MKSLRVIAEVALFLGVTCWSGSLTYLGLQRVSRYSLGFYYFGLSLLEVSTSRSAYDFLRLWNAAVVAESVSALVFLLTRSRMYFSCLGSNSPMSYS